MYDIIILVFVVIGGFTVIVFLLKLLLRKNVEEIKFDPSKYNSIPNEKDIKVKIDELLSKNNTIQAVKYLKDNKKMGLKEAKNMIEKYAESNSSAALNVFNKMKSTLDDENELVTRIKSLLSQGKKIDAIKLVVESRKVGLKEAKNFVDTIV